MGMTTKIIRRSINAFFQNYHSFSSIAAILVFPASASTLLCQAFVTSPTKILQTVSFRLHLLFQAACFPASNKFFALINLKLSQTILSFILTLPFILTFLLLAKASVVRLVFESPRYWIDIQSSASCLRRYRSVLLTHLFNYFVVLCINATFFVFLFIVFNAVDIISLLSSNSQLVLSAVAAVIYSIIISNTMVICNLAIVVSVVNDCSGYLAVLKACSLIRGKVMIALGLALPANLGMAAVEALFQYRVIRQYNHLRQLNSSMMWETFSITYFHALMGVLDVIVSCMFFRSCSLNCYSNFDSDDDIQNKLDPEEKCSLQV